MTSPIGIFDSGIGGLSVLRHLHALLPQEQLIYFADQAHVPYGPRPAADVQEFSERITQFLLDRDAKLIVVACNTASAAALTFLRQQFPETPFVGMEPAVKPGAQSTRSGKVGVLATAGTFESQRYASLMRRFARDVTLFENPCDGLVELIEAGKVDDAETEALLRPILTPMLAQGVDTLVLGCTHYPFVMPLLRRLVGETVTIIDPAPAVARQALRVLHARSLLGHGRGNLYAYTTGPAEPLAAFAARLLPFALPTSSVAWPSLAAL